jgi:hypothetical protein
VKILTTILLVYFLILFPAIHLVFSGKRFLFEFWPFLYFAFVLLLLIALKRISLKQLGFYNTRKSLAIGTILGVLPIICVSLIDSFLLQSGLSQSELFTGATLRAPEEMRFDISLSGNIFTTFIIPFLDQVFVVGLVVNNVLKKQNTGQAIIGSGLIYSLIHFKPSLGNLFLGMISAGLLRATESIIPSILVHTGFAIAEVIIILYYPRLISFLVFLV